MKNKLELYLKKHLFLDSFGSRKSYTTFDNSLEECSLIDVDSYITKNKNDNEFVRLLFKHIDSRGIKDSDLYNSVGIDRRLFSKIRDSKYHTSKDTIILLGIGLKLNIKELEDLLGSASYYLPMNNTRDLIIRFSFENKIYDVNTVNEFLYSHDCSILNEKFC